MDNIFIGQICFFAFGLVPKGWLVCDGRILQAGPYQALAALLGTLYGGNGTTTFGFPDLRGAVPMGFSPSYRQGSKGGEETHKLTTGEIPGHIHTLNADGQTSAAANTFMPALNTLLGITGDATGGGVSIYGSSGGGTMASQTVGNAGHDVPQENRMPYLAMNACIAFVGFFPQRS